MRLNGGKIGMLSKNNYQERLRKMDDKQERFSIRKFSVGAASVLVGTAVLSISCSC
ncbi:YSIRK-type signal peptide-containing protein [Lactobacillus johnsonii]|uniref:YSIRK-type signal peptide-containing protein n=1 Tax=Lactobacillus johnsonii TaxID=33959 RepID=UPI0031FF00DA